MVSSISIVTYYRAALKVKQLEQHETDKLVTKVAKRIIALIIRKKLYSGIIHAHEVQCCMVSKYGF